MALSELAVEATQADAARSVDRGPHLATVARPLDYPAHTPLTISLFRYAPAMAFLLVVIANAQRLTDPDLWGHLRFGQAVLTAHHLVRTDPYSYTALGHPWRNHEWLTEVLMAVFYNHLGVIGLKLWKLSCVAATIGSLVFAMAETGASAAIQLNLLMVAVVAVMPQMQFRPQLFTFALFAALLALLARHAHRGVARLWLIIPMMALWANLHGGFIAGLGVLGVYTAVTGARALFLRNSLVPAVRLGLLTLAALLATLLTPYGVDTWIAVLHALRNPVTRTAINDWQPLLFHLARQWHQWPLGASYYLCALLLMATTLIAFALAPNFDDLPLMAVAVLMIVAAFTAVRNMPLAVMACLLPAARHLSLALMRGAEPRNREERSSTNQFVVAIAAAFLIFYSGACSPRLETEQPYPARAVSFMQAHGLRGNILGDFGWGEYLIWHAPESKVFIDGRYDTVFADKTIRDYVKLYFDLPGADRAISDYAHDFILLPPAAPIVRKLSTTPGWQLVYRDEAAVLFARSSVAAALHGAPLAIGGASKHQYFP
ncbi:MAG TPA: hypothetical protein VNU00_10005 [Candidatus Binataceae bacterium]|nr:hypothetical protein [Candidatus Binataceae bacterium]